MQNVEREQIGVHCILACLYFLLLPTTIVLVSVGNSILKVSTVPIGMYFLLTLLFSDRKLQLNGVQLALLVFTLSAVCTLFWNASKDSLYSVLGYILNAALYICLTLIPYKKAELELMEKIQIILLIILNVITLMFRGTEDNRTTLVIGGQASDPNYFVGYFIFPLTIAMKQLFSAKNRILYVLLICVSIYSIFLSGSRGGLLAVAVTIAAFAMIYPSEFVKRIVILLSGAVFLLLIWIVLKPILPENIIERMSVKDVLESGGTGRVKIWESMLNDVMHQPENLIFGRGLAVLHTVFLDGNFYRVYAHNQVVQIIYNQGLVGFISFFLLTGISFFRCIKRRKTVSIAILGMMALSLSLSFNQTTRTFWNLIAYAAFAFPDDEIITKNNGGISDNE